MLARLRNPKVAVSIVFVTAMFMTILDSTIVNVALPSVARRFDASTATAGAVITAYLVSLAVFIPASGWLGDRFGDKRVLLVALVLFTLASGLCGAAMSVSELIVFRILQGVGGGMLTPVGMAMLFRTFPQHERMRASRILVVPTALAPSIGPVLGGLLVDQLSWRWVFFVNLPIGAAALVFGALFVSESHGEQAGSFDLAGFLLAGLGLAGLMYALGQGAGDGWTSATILASGLCGAALLALLWIHESRTAEPMLDVRLLANRLFGSSTLVTLLAFAAFLGMLYAFAQFQQLGLGRSPLESGLLTFPEAVGVMSFSQIISRLYLRTGPRRLAAGGMAGVAVLTVILSFETAATPLVWVVIVMYALGCSMSGVFLSLQTSAFAQISNSSTSHASSMYNAVRQIGAALGVSILATVISVVGPAPAGASGAAASSGSRVHAYHAAFLSASALAVMGAVVAWTLIRDADARSTMADATPTRAESATTQPVTVLD
jgi:EmrB/QacA subfamily drug resistance transporter